MIIEQTDAQLRALRAAERLVAAHAPDGPDKVDVLRRLGLLRARVAQSTGLVQTCRSCNEAFVLSPAEVSYFHAQRLNVPTHCGRCRIWRRHEKSGRGAPRVDTEAAR